MAWQSGLGSLGLALVGYGQEGQGRRGLVCCGTSRCGPVMCGKAGKVRQVEVEQVEAWRGIVTAGLQKKECDHLGISWVKGSHFKVDAETAKSVMDQLAQEGRLTPAELVEVSRPENAPLHGEFEWNDTIAAAKWREQTGRVMIASISVTVDKEEDAVPVRAYFNIEHTSHEYIA